MMQLPTDIPSALTYPQAHRLWSMAESKNVLEVGSLLGYSTIVLAQSANLVVSIDPHRGYPVVAPRPTLSRFLANLTRYEVRDKVGVCVGKHTEFVHLFEDDSFDLVFIDADGTYETTFDILDSVREKVEWGGYFVVHDMNNWEWAGAEKAVESFIRVWDYPWRMIDDVAIIKRESGRFVDA